VASRKLAIRVLHHLGQVYQTDILIRHLFDTGIEHDSAEWTA
jgi:hypothetical protein